MTKLSKATRKGWAALTHALPLATIFTAALLPSAAQAQAYQCRVPQNVSVPQIKPYQKARNVPITGYTLALSWSPEFCKKRKTSQRHEVQCSGRNGRFGLVVHGLWPEGRSSWPQWCPTPRRPSPAEARKNLCMMPSPYLVAHEWARHGACMTRKPETYYKVTRILWNSLTFPDLDRLSRDDDLNVGALRAAFARANGPRWQPEHVGVKLNRRGWLQELRLCYGRDFLPTRCNSQQFGPRDSAKVKIWRGL